MAMAGLSGERERGEAAPREGTRCASRIRHLDAVDCHDGLHRIVLARGGAHGRGRRGGDTELSALRGPQQRQRIDCLPSQHHRRRQPPTALFTAPARAATRHVHTASQPPPRRHARSQRLAGVHRGARRGVQRDLPRSRHDRRPPTRLGCFRRRAALRAMPPMRDRGHTHAAAGGAGGPLLARASQSVQPRQKHRRGGCLGSCVAPASPVQAAADMGHQ